MSDRPLHRSYLSTTFRRGSYRCENIMCGQEFEPVVFPSAQTGEYVLDSTRDRMLREHTRAHLVRYDSMPESCPDGGCRHFAMGRGFVQGPHVATEGFHLISLCCSAQATSVRVLGVTDEIYTRSGNPTLRGFTPQVPTYIRSQVLETGSRAVTNATPDYLHRAELRQR